MVADHESERLWRTVVKHVLLIRTLRLLRLLTAFRRFQEIYVTFGNLLPAFSTLFGMLLALFCFYAQLGVQLFGGAVYRGNPGLSPPAFPDSYYVNNFNDFASGVVTLFELLVVNNWYVIMDGVVAAVDNNQWARAYFISWYVLAVIVVTNLVVAFILEGFFEIEDTHSRMRSSRSRSSSFAVKFDLVN